MKIKMLAVLPLFSLLMPFSVLAQGKINRVSTMVRDGVELLKIETDGGKLVIPDAFSIQSPARIVLDFPG